MGLTKAVMALRCYQPEIANFLNDSVSLNRRVAIRTKIRTLLAGFEAECGAAFSVARVPT